MSNIHTLLASPYIRAAAAAANLGEEAFYNQTLTKADPANIRTFMKAASQMGFSDIRSALIQAYDDVHSRVASKIYKNREEFLVTQTHVNQQFLDLALMPMAQSLKVEINGLTINEGFDGPNTVGYAGDYAVVYGGKYPTIYRVVGDIGVKERTTVLINNTGSFFDTTGAAGKYFTINSATTNASHYFWFKATDAGSPAVDPAPGGTGHEVDILLADTAAQIATKLNAVVAALSTLFTSSVSTATVTITNFNIGAVTLATAATSGATVTRTVLGVNSNLNNKYMAIIPYYTQPYGDNAQNDMLLYFNVDGLADTEVVYANSQAGYEDKLNGITPMKVNIASGASASTVATAIATAIRQYFPNHFIVADPSATAAVKLATGTPTSSGTATTGAVLTVTDASDIAPGMPVTWTGAPGGLFVASVSGLNITLTPGVVTAAPTSGLQFSFSYVPLKVYKHDEIWAAAEVHVKPVSTLVNTAGSGFNMSNCFQVIATPTFDTSYSEIGGRLLFGSAVNAGRTLNTVTIPGDTLSGSTYIANLKTGPRYGIPGNVPSASYYVSGPGIPAGTLVGQINIANFGAGGVLSVKKNKGTKELTVVDANGNPTTIAAVQAASDLQPAVLNGTIASVTTTGDLAYGSTAVSNITVAGLVVGMQVQGPHINLGTTITAIGATSLTLSLAVGPAQGPLAGSGANFNPATTYTGQTLLFGSVTAMATQVYASCVTVNGSPYLQVPTGSPNICRMMGVAGTGINALAQVMDISVSGSITTITMSHSATASGSISATFTVKGGMKVTGTGVPAGTFVSGTSGTTLLLSNIPTAAGIGVQALTFKTYFMPATVGCGIQASALPLGIERRALGTQQTIVRSRIVGPAEIITANHECHNDGDIYPYSVSVFISEEMVLNQPATATASGAALIFTCLNPVQQLKTDLVPLKVGDMINVAYDVDDEPLPTFKIEKNIPYDGPNWDGTDAGLDFTQSGYWMYQTNASTSQFTDMYYKVKGEGIPIISLPNWANGGTEDFSMGYLSTNQPSGKLYQICYPGVERPFPGFTEAEGNDPAAWGPSTISGNRFSAFRVSNIVRSICAMVERLNIGPALLLTYGRQETLLRHLLQHRPDLFRGAMNWEPFVNFMDGGLPAATGAGTHNLWNTVGYSLIGNTTNGSTSVIMGSGATIPYTLGFYNGMAVSGPGIPGGTTISSFTSNSVVLSAAATLTATSQLLFGGGVGTSVRKDFVAEYCSSNDETSVNPNMITGDVTSGSAVISNIPSTLGIIKGMSVTGTGINASDTPISCSTTSGSTTISNISAGDIAKIKVGMIIYGVGANNTATFTNNPLTLEVTNKFYVAFVGASSVVCSQALNATNANNGLWFVNLVKSVSANSITLTSPAFTTGAAVSIRGRMLNRDSNYYKWNRLHHQKRGDWHQTVIAGVGKHGLMEGSNANYSSAGTGGMNWSLSGALPGSRANTTDTVQFPNKTLVAQYDDGYSQNAYSSIAAAGGATAMRNRLFAFEIGSNLNLYGLAAGTAVYGFDSGAGPGVDQGSGIYRNSSQIYGYTANGSNLITNVVTTYVANGAAVAGTGIPGGATVSSFTPSTVSADGKVNADGVITLSTNATASSAGLTIVSNISTGSPIITVADATGIFPGELVIGTGIAVGTTVVSLSGTSITLSANPTATNPTASLVFASVPVLLTLSGTPIEAILTQPFKFLGRLAVIPSGQHVRRALSNGEEELNGTMQKIQGANGSDLPQLTKAQLQARCQGQIYLRIENANLWSFACPQTGWGGSVTVGEAYEWSMGPSFCPRYLNMNPYNDVGPGPMSLHYQYGTANWNTYYLQQYIAEVSNTVAGTGYEWQMLRNAFFPRY